MRPDNAISPYSLLQEELRGDTWKTLVACMLLNQTSYKQVRPIIWHLFERYPDAKALSCAKQEELAGMIRALGFQNRRSKALIRMSGEYVAGIPVRQLYGVGQYALDSCRMFVEGDVENVRPTDAKLIMYRDWWLNG